jgi:MinD-like ATPase involved in chromosome partitioning or flagellar assembly
MNPRTEIGKVITFYSFKGGVGRSMSLANIAIMLAKWNYRVLVIDWDLEAPGLENFYSSLYPLEKAKAKPGLIDLLLSRSQKNNADRPSVDWEDCLVSIRVDRSNITDAKIDLLTAGQINDEYYEKVRSFDFKSFYNDHNGGNIIEELRTEWIREYDFVLVDSRTGVTDIGGVCTVQLPDILVVFFTPTLQGLEGVKRVALKAMKAQRELPFERINLMTLPIATRIDNSEYELSKEWFKKFAVELQEVYAGWLPDTGEQERINFLLNSKVPYISYFSFGEKLPVIEEGSANPTGMGFSYESIAALLANKLDDAYSLLLDRNKLIEKASTRNGMEISTSIPVIKKVMNLFQAIDSAVKISLKVLPYLGVITVGILLFLNYDREKKAEKAELQSTRISDSLRYLNVRLSDSIHILKSRLGIDDGFDDNPGIKALMKAVLELKQNAKSTVLGKHMGPFVAKYNGIANLEEGYPWAATFVCWCFNYPTSNFPSTGSVSRLESYFTKEGQTFSERITTPIPGDIYFYDWKGQRAVGIVENWDNYSLVGIEGNSSDKDNGPLDQVARVHIGPKELITNNFIFARVTYANKR